MNRHAELLYGLALCAVILAVLFAFADVMLAAWVYLALAFVALWKGMEARP